MNRNKLLGIISVLLVLGGGLWFFIGKKNNAGKKPIWVKPKQGLFEVVVKSSGELVAKNSKAILGPSGLRKAGLNQVKITDLIAEGTVVSKDDYVASLDRSELTSKITEADLNVQKYTSTVETEKLDCTLTLSQAREDIINLHYALEQKSLEKEQSAFEPPATRRQTEIEYEKANRNLKQAEENYKTKVKQAIAKMRIAESDLNKAKNSLDELRALAEEFTIKAPQNGMVIYEKEWNGKKRIVGSTINMWDQTVATLPDFSVMESVTKINEVDIRKLKPGQTVLISLDADPSKKLEGKISEVANIGEDAKGSDSKVFEVRILVETRDSTLRPAMTTSNQVNIAKEENRIFIPLECLHSEDSVSFVYRKEGFSIVKQEVRIGLMNDNEVVILEGLKPEDEISLNTPPEADKLSLNRLK